jgi:conjugal transfer pilus assembly protein TraU
MKQKFLCCLLVTLWLIISFTNTSWAVCESRFVNLVSDICWNCMFPLKIGGVTVFGTTQPDTVDIDAAGGNTICTCTGSAGVNIPGLTVSFWEPVRIIDAVMDPWCFPAFGMEINGITGSGQLRGTVGRSSPKRASGGYFAQVHDLHFPVWSILDLFIDVPCITEGDFDISYMSELDATWQDDFLALLLNPEALVFGNPATQFACMADAVQTATGLPRDELFWCMGQWGSAYPLTGHVGTANQVLGPAAAASRLIYRLIRTGIMCDHAIDPCRCMRLPIWRKSHYRLQILRPRANTGTTIRIGEPSPLWESMQSVSGEKGSENFSFLLFRKVNCCVFYRPSVSPVP